MLQLRSTAEVTGLDILTYVARHLWPPVVASDQFEGFEPTRVASDVRVVVLLDDPSVKLAVLWNVNLSSKQHQPLRLRPLSTPHHPLPLSLWSLRAAFATGSSCLSSRRLCQMSLRISRSRPTRAIAESAWMRKSSGDRRVMLSLSFCPLPWSARRERALGLPMLVPGLCCNVKSKRERKSDHLACRRLSFCAIRKYSRFLWSVRTSTGWRAPSR